MLAYAVRKKGDPITGKPFFRLYGAHVHDAEPNILRFEHLIVDEVVTVGDEECVFYQGETIPTRRLLVRWPGLHIGRYDHNALRILGEHHEPES